MNRPKTAAITLALLYGVLVALVAESYPRPLERIATHRKPDGWTGRPAYVASILVGAALVAVVCAGVTYIPRYLPDSSLNTPNREH